MDLKRFGDVLLAPDRIAAIESEGDGYQYLVHVAGVSKVFTFSRESAGFAHFEKFFKEASDGTRSTPPGTVA
jgi:hypothetical protein